MKREKAGFTLAELLVVVAIIGVLVAVAIPVFGGALDKAREAACAANCRSLKGELTTLWLTTDGSDTEKKAAVETAFQAAATGGICPSGGTISYALDIKDGAVCGVTVHCSEHNPTVEQKVLTEFGAIVGDTSLFQGQDNPGYCATNNDRLREYYFDKIIKAENEDGTWPTKDFGGQTYYVQPYYDTYTKKTVIYANGNESNDKENKWAANAIYFPEGTTVGNESYSGWYYGTKSFCIVGRIDTEAGPIGSVFIGYSEVVKNMNTNYWRKLN